VPVIKRYPNRKLYDTEAKQYITLDEIANKIRQGEEIRVIDNASGEDLTALTLTQIIFEQEKKQSGFLPRTVLSGLIQAGGNRLSAIQRTLASSIGFWHQIDEEIKRRVQVLIDQGELTVNEGKDLIEKLLAQSKGEEPEPQVNEPMVSTRELEQYLAEHKLPTREDIKKLLAELEALENRLDQMEK
jgi:polyhydroxyalkanoate synthesis repressor PhaR